jgi:hypothetical protein
MDTQNRELWDRLENEPDKAYRAFECFLSLPSGERTLLEAYRRHVSNPDAAKPSDTWSGWSNTFAWRERVAAYDDHLAIVRREAYERAVEEEVTRQAREVEKARYRSNELMTLGYEEAMHWFEEVGASGMRASDVIQIMRLHLDYLKVFGMEQGSRNEDDWTEEDDEFVETILKEMEAETAADELDEGEDGSESVNDDAG